MAGQFDSVQCARRLFVKDMAIGDEISACLIRPEDERGAVVRLQVTAASAVIKVGGDGTCAIQVAAIHKVLY
ncbi:hypothetical protein A5733_02130 [Mycobacterium sp. NS-7484]|nr:hypothetical protein A5733_02130 [Mycobacterium sp. NS-7484]